MIEKDLTLESQEIKNELAHKIFSLIIILVLFAFSIIWNFISISKVSFVVSILFTAFIFPAIFITSYKLYKLSRLIKRYKMLESGNPHIAKEYILAYKKLQDLKFELSHTSNSMKRTKLITEINRVKDFIETL